MKIVLTPDEIARLQRFPRSINQRPVHRMQPIAPRKSEPNREVVRRVQAPVGRDRAREIPGGRRSDTSDENADARSRKRPAAAHLHFAPDAVRGLEPPKGPGGNAIIWATTLGFALMIMLLSVSKFDVVVVAPGYVSSHQAGVQLHTFDRALVRSVRVFRGKRVEEGEVMIEFDPVQTGLALRRAQDQSARLDAEHAMLDADINERAMARGSGAVWQHHVDTLATQLRARREQRRIFQFQEQRARTAQASAQAQQNVLARRRASAEQILRGRQQLHARGNSTTSQLNDAVQEFARLEQEALEVQQRLASADHDLQTVAAERDRWEEEWRLSVRARLAEVERQRIEMRRDLAEAEFRAAQNVFRAPFAAIVLDVADRATGGSVTGGGEALLRLARADAPVHVVVDVEARESAWVRAGLEAQVEFSGLEVQRHGYMLGRVQTVTPTAVERSVSSVEGERRGHTHRVVLSLDEKSKENLRNVPPGFAPSPGQAVTTRIKVGERAPIWYLLDPLIGAGGDAFSRR